jgi:hypothetical protein
MISTRIRIGGGRRVIDVIILLVDASILGAATFLVFKNPAAYPFLITAILFIGLHARGVLQRHYVFIEDDHFILENLLRKPKTVDCTEFATITKDHFTIPFSNLMIINFRTGESFRFLGGLRNAKEIDFEIKRAMLSNLRRKLKEESTKEAG